MSRKVVIIGTGMVGASYGYAMANQNVADEIILIDINKDLANAHAQDITDGNVFLRNNIKVKAGDYTDCTDADLVCVTAGAAQKDGQTRLDLAVINAKITKDIVSNIMANNFNGVLLMAINPVDVMTYVAQKVSGLDKNKVIGSGTALDSARFRKNLSNYFNINSKSIHARIIGEHGDSSLPLISKAQVGAQDLTEFIEDSNGKFSMDVVYKCFEDARDAAYSIIKYKGSTYYGIGLSLTNITRNILIDQNATLSLSVILDGEYGLNDVCISVPVVVGKSGITRVFDLKLADDEISKLQQSADEIKSAINIIKNEGII